jgi:chemotaxis protein MotA
MISLPIGFVAFVIVLILTAAGVDASHYMNMHSLIIVGGGTVAVFAISTSTVVIRSVFRNVFDLFSRRRSVTDVKDELRRLANNRASVSSSKDPLIQYAIGLWEKGVDNNTFQALLSQYRDKLENEDAKSVGAIHNIAKYPPALGMMGTVMGMISLFASLGTSNKTSLGPALAVAMTATFYGLLLANGLLSPLADRLTVESVYRKKYFALVYEVLTLINRREPVNMIEEELTNREAA